MNYRSMRSRVSEFWLDHGRKAIIGTSAVAAVGGAGFYFYSQTPELGLGETRTSVSAPRMEMKSDIKESSLKPEIKPEASLQRFASRTHAKSEGGSRHVHKSKHKKSFKTPACAKSKKHLALHKKHKASSKGKVVKAKKHKSEATQRYKA